MGPLLDVVNMRLMRTAIELLAPEAKDTVLDVGFGGGYSLWRLARKVTQGKVIGVDYSPEMVNRAASLIRLRRLSSRVEARCADVANLPFPARTFDKALTVNSIYYWPDAMAGLGEIARVMKPRARLVVGFRSAASLRLFTRAWDGFTLYEPREVSNIMRRAGFKILRVVHQDRFLPVDMVLLLGQVIESPPSTGITTPLT